jgi:hypothetical protein
MIIMRRFASRLPVRLPSWRAGRRHGARPLDWVFVLDRPDSGGKERTVCPSRGGEAVEIPRSDREEMDTVDACQSLEVGNVRRQAAAPLFSHALVLA